MFKIYGIAGLAMVFISFIISIFGFEHILFEIISVTMLFTTGFWLFLDALDYSLNGSSILHKIMKKKKVFFYIVITGIFIGLVFDFFGILISDLWQWYYASKPAFLATIYYIRGLIWGYGIPILMYYSFYRVIMHLVDKEFPHRFGAKLAGRKTTKKMFRYLLAAGITALIIPLAAYPFFSGTGKFFGTATFLLVLLGMWFILEYIEHKRKEKTFLEDIITGHWRPVAGIIIAAVLTALLWEGLNVIKGDWAYTNLFWQEIKVLGVPIQVIAGWILLYIVYLSFYRAVIKDKDLIWE